MLLAAFALGLSSCVETPTETTCQLVTDDFDPIVEYKGTVDITKLKFLVKMGTQAHVVTVTKDMVISMDSTNTVGSKTLLLLYQGQDYTVNFEVRYKGQFFGENEMLSTQYVLTPDDLTEVTPPEKEGYTFVGWAPSIPAEFSANMLFVAQYEKSKAQTPALTELTATYGDTLASLTLPKNSAGEWQFVDDLTTTVGNVGKNTFKVVFVPTDASQEQQQGQVSVRVRQKKLTFYNIEDTFVYDGEVHTPIYSVSPAVSVSVIGDFAAEAGEYAYELVVTDPNYEGEYKGTLTIAKRDVTVTVVIDGAAELPYGEALPSITYTLEGFEDAEKIGLTLHVPNAPTVGVYTVTVTAQNPNFNLTVNEKTLTVVKADPKLELETLVNGVPQRGADYPRFVTTAVFGQLLSEQEFAGNAVGQWVFVDGAAVINTPTSYTTDLRFVPFDTANYNEIFLEGFTFEVAKKEVTLEIVGNTTFVYDGQEHTIAYVVKDGETVLTDVVVVGVLSETNKGDYYGTLTLLDDRYAASLSTTLTILAAVPETDFAALAQTLVWRPGLTLADLVLPAGYSWKTPSTEIDTVGSFQMEALYTPQDTHNYVTVYNTIALTVEKADANINGVQPTYSFPYTGGAYTISGYTATHNEASIQIVYLFNGAVVNELLNAGEYTILFTLPETGHYKGAEAEATFIITAVDAEGEQPPSPMNATFENTLGDLTLPENEYGVWSWLDGGETSVGSVGSHVFTAVFTPYTDNYNSMTLEITVYVAKKQLTLEILSREFVYDGNEHTILYRITDGTREYTLTVVGNLVYTDAGTYVTELIIEDDSYEGRSGVTSLVIAKAACTPTMPDALTATFGDRLSTVALPTDPMGEWSWKTPDALVGTAGTHTFEAVFTPRDTDNYEIYTTSFEVTVAKKTVVTPQITNSTVVYTGREILPIIYTSDLYTVSALTGFVNAGSYDIVLTLADADNYAWTTTDEATVTLVFTIAQAQAVISGVAVDGWTYEVLC